MLDDSEVVVVVDPGPALAESFVFVVVFDASMIESVYWKMSLSSDQHALLNKYFIIIVQHVNTSTRKVFAIVS